MIPMLLTTSQGYLVPLMAFNRPLSIRMCPLVKLSQWKVGLPHLLSGITATGDDGNTANLEELHFGCWSGRGGLGMKFVAGGYQNGDPVAGL